MVVGDVDGSKVNSSLAGPTMSGCTVGSGGHVSDGNGCTVCSDAVVGGDVDGSGDGSSLARFRLCNQVQKWSVQAW